MEMKYYSIYKLLLNDPLEIFVMVLDAHIPTSSRKSGATELYISVRCQAVGGHHEPQGQRAHSVLAASNALGRIVVGGGVRNLHQQRPRTVLGEWSLRLR